MSDTPPDKAVPQPVTRDDPPAESPAPAPKPPVDSARALELAALEATLPPPTSKPQSPRP